MKEKKKYKIVVITLTCNRLELTKKYINQLEEKGGYDFEHIVVDNGSTDGTVEWLKSQGKFTIIRLAQNYGIVDAWKVGIKYAFENFNPDFIVKFDNDIEIKTDNILQKLCDFYSQGCDNYVISPFELSLLMPEYQRFRPRIIAEKLERNYKVQYVPHTSAMLQMIPRRAIELFLKETDKKVIGGDLLRGIFWRKNGFDMLYLMELEIFHAGVEQQTKNYKLV